MADLAALTLRLPRPGLPQGQCICTRLDDGTIRVDQADPRVLISAELLALIVVNDALYVTLDYDPLLGAAFYTGAVLKIHGVNQQVVYRIGEYVPSVRCYIGEWPD
jgi:hypothetical protein